MEQLLIVVVAVMSFEWSIFHSHLNPRTMAVVVDLRYCYYLLNYSLYFHSCHLLISIEKLINLVIFKALKTHLNVLDFYCVDGVCSNFHLTIGFLQVKFD